MMGVSGGTECIGTTSQRLSFLISEDCPFLRGRQFEQRVTILTPLDRETVMRLMRVDRMGDQEAEAVIVCLEEECIETCNGLLYKVCHSVPVVLYLKPFLTTGLDPDISEYLPAQSVQIDAEPPSTCRRHRWSRCHWQRHPQ